jgi:hypothetical protein
MTQTDIAALEALANINARAPRGPITEHEVQIFLQERMDHYRRFSITDAQMRLRAIEDMDAQFFG